MREANEAVLCLIDVYLAAIFIYIKSVLFIKFKNDISS